MTSLSPDISKKRIELFDLLRTFAVAAVVLVHFGGLHLKGSFANAAVDLFFVLSAVLVSEPLLNAYKRREGSNFHEFFVKRLTKILPSYYFFIISGTLLAFWIIKPISPENVITLRELPEYLFFYRNYAGPPPRLTFEHVWSLCVEEQFYLMLPMAFVLARKKFNYSIGKLVVSLLLVALLGVFFKVQALFTNFAEWPTYTHNRIDAFAWGILTLIFLNSHYALNSTTFKRLQPFIGLSGLIIFLLLVSFDFRDSDPHELILRTVSPICWALVIIGFIDAKVIFAGTFKRIALYSYNIYLWHFIFIIPVEYYFGTGITGFMVYISLTCIISIFSTHFIERRFLRYRAPILKFLQPKQATEAKQIASPVRVFK